MHHRPTNNSLMTNISNYTWKGSSSFNVSTTEIDLVSAYIQVVFIILLSVVCVFGNVLLLATISYNRELRTASNIYITNLAITDLGVAFLVLPMWAYTTLQHGVPFNQDICKLVAMATVVFTMESVLTLGGVAFDRYLIICHPLKYPNMITHMKVGVITSCTWIHAFILASLPFMGFGSFAYFPNQLSMCTIIVLQSKGYVILILFTAIIPSYVIVCLCYTKIFRVAKHHARQISTQINPKQIPSGNKVHPMQPQTSNMNRDQSQWAEPARAPHNQRIKAFPGQTKKAPVEMFLEEASVTSSQEGFQLRETDRKYLSIPEEEEEEEEEEEQAQEEQETRNPAAPRQSHLWRRTSALVKTSFRHTRGLKTVATIMGCFLACWTPYIILIVVTISSGHLADGRIDFLITFLAFANSGLNPFICVSVNRDFRKGVKKLLGLYQKELLRDVVNAFSSRNRDDQN